MHFKLLVSMSVHTGDVSLRVRESEIESSNSTRALAQTTKKLNGCSSKCLDEEKVIYPFAIKLLSLSKTAFKLFLTRRKISKL